ncbi:MAG: hypothetical protein L6R38_002872 [Xanthoria sp. 2 TBL-2021]|nr:MAG: hypothetical protein L6R38_002872 [Xanthoria sp. 2 TBL-2021]
MAPLRNNRSSNRSGRSQVDHDVFEGLPVRHWRKAPVAVSTAPPKEEPTTNSARDTLFVELAMPRDSQLLSPMSQALLRAARSGEMTKKAAPQPLQEDEKENADDDEPPADVDLGFMAKRWAAVPRHLEGPEPEFLAKRRKGLPSAYTGSVGPTNGAIPMRKTKVRKLDANGNASVLDVLVPEGQTVDGEVLEDETNVTQAPAPGTVVEGVGVANAEGIIVAGDQILPTPPRRRPPPPKRKAKGPGRGRKKRVAFAPGTDGLNHGDSVLSPNNGANGVNRPSAGRSGDMTSDGDAIMGDDLVLQNGDESSEEDDEGDEGEGEGEDGDREDGELSPSPKLSQSPPKKASLGELSPPAHFEQLPEITTQSAEPREASPGSPTRAPQREVSSSPDMPLNAEREMVDLSNLSNPLDVRILDSQAAAEPVTVEETLTTTEQPLADMPVMAELPPKHNPLDGLAAPEPPAITISPEPETQVSDGEVDLLGSLEKQLNRNDAAMSTAM